MNTPRWPAVVSLALLIASSTLAMWYGADGHRAVAEAVARGDQSILRNLLTGDGPFTPADYIAAADHATWAVQGVLLGTVLALLVGRLGHRLWGPLYDATIRALDRAASARWAVRAAAGAILVLVLAWIAVSVLQRFPNSGDEFCYLYQAETFALGRVTNAAHPLQEFFGFHHVRQVGDRVFSVFPPGWPAVLAAALLTGMPTWLVNPVLGAVLVWLTWTVARRLTTARSAVAAAAVVAVSPFFLFNSASFFAHTWCAILILAYAYAGIRAIDGSRVGWAGAAGAALGMALVARNYTAVWCAAPFAIALLRRGRPGWRALAATAAAGAPFVLLALWYADATMGSPFAQAMGGGFEAYDDRWFPRGWVGRGLEITAGHLVNFLRWTPPALLAIYAWTWRPRRGGQGPPPHFVDGIFPALVLGYFIYVDRGGNSYGPRYYFEAFPFVAIAVAARVFASDRAANQSPSERWAFYLLAASVAACLPIGLALGRAESAVITERTEPYRLAAERVRPPAVVFVASGAGWLRPMGARDLTRNDPDWTAPVLWAHDRGPENARLMGRYPDRAAWRYVFDPRARTGRIEAIVVP